jgi:class 3 adenylate cyclase
LAFLFTDLQDSTGLYERVGDDDAYEIVRLHFAFVARIVVGYRGVVVKTTGDGVMATFDRPVAAVRTAVAIQARIGDFNRLYARGDYQRHLAVKLGIHWGGSLRTEDDCGGPDYFGSAVNLAARLRGYSQGGDIVLSEVVVDHPGVRLLLARLETRWESLPFKGFSEPVRVARVMPAVGQVDVGEAAPSPAGVRSLIGATRALWVLGDPRSI